MAGFFDAYFNPSMYGGSMPGLLSHLPEWQAQNMAPGPVQQSPMDAMAYYPGGLPQTAPQAQQPAQGQQAPVAAAPMVTPSVAPPPSMMSRLGEGIANNPAMLIGMGAGLMSGQGWGGALQGGLVGGQADIKNRATRQAQQAVYQALVQKGISHNEALAAASNPEVAKLILERVYAKPEPQQFHVAGETAFSFNPATGGVKSLGEVPKNVTLGPEQSLYRQSGGGLTPLVTGKSPEQSAESRKIAEGLGASYTDLQNKSQSAEKTLNTLDRLEKLSPLAFSGTGAEAKTKLGSFLSGYGVLGENVNKTVAASEQFKALSNELVMAANNGSLGAGVSNADVSFIQSRMPGIEQTKAGRDSLIEAGKKLAQRDKEVANLATEYRAKSGSMAGFNQYLADWANKNPMFPQAAAKPASSGWKILGVE